MNPNTRLRHWMLPLTLRLLVPAAAAATALAWLSPAPAARVPDNAGAHQTPSYVADARPAADALDGLILDAAAAESLEPAPRVDDAAFLRRLTLDLIARIPTAAEYHAYFADPPDTRRDRLIDRLLNDPRFVERWAMFFGDMMNIRSGADGGGQFHTFIKRSIAQRKPYDQMVRELVTATGSLRDNAPVGFYTGVNADPLQVTGILTQTLMGVRMQCAQCHDHPYDVWTQKDYYSMAAYFGATDVRSSDQLGLYVVDTDGNTIRWPPKPRPGRPQKPVDPDWPIAQVTGQEQGLADAIAVMDQKKQRRAEQQELADLFADVERADPTGAAERNPIDEASQLMGELVAAQDAQTRREAFATLVTDPTNRYFGWNLSNRVWAQLMGRGLVEPVDDIKSGNPPSHPEVLDHLADQLLASNYDLRQLIAVIVASDTYQRARLDGLSPKQREPRERAFVAAPLRRMNAESLFDSIRLAGHVGDYKHSPGRNARQITVRVRVPVEPPPESAPETDPESDPEAAPETAAETRPAEGATPMMASMAGAGVEVDDPFSSESSIDPDMLLEQLAADEDDPLAGRRVIKVNPDDVDPEVIAMREEQARQNRNNPRRYEVKTYTRTIDDNPRFDSAFSVRAPAPPEHFLRQFGQTSRVILGEKRDTAANTRQALLLLNGKLTNEAARVGDLEPVYRLLHDDVPAAKAIELIYLECLTRETTPEELARAEDIFRGYEKRADAVADLRWAIFNSHEFRYVP